METVSGRLRTVTVCSAPYCNMPKLRFETDKEPYKDVLKTESLTVAVGEGENPFQIYKITEDVKGKKKK